MKTHDTWEAVLQPADVRQLLLDQAVVRAKQEHELLERELRDIYEQACSVRGDANAERLGRGICRLRYTVKHFMAEWQSHVRREEVELFPYAALYFGAEPDLFDLMEQEYEKVEESIRTFLQESSRSAFPFTHEDASRMTSHLFQAYAALKNRFVEEEEIMRELVRQ